MLSVLLTVALLAQDESEPALLDPSDPAPLEDKCALNDLPSCVTAGLRYAQRQGDSGAQLKANELFDRACAGGDHSGCFQLGGRYYYGQGVARDRQKADELLRRACDGQEANACMMLGAVYRRQRQNEQARTFYQKACVIGLANACTAASSIDAPEDKNLPPLIKQITLDCDLEQIRDWEAALPSGRSHELSYDFTVALAFKDKKLARMSFDGQKLKPSLVDCIREEFSRRGKYDGPERGLVSLEVKFTHKVYSALDLQASAPVSPSRGDMVRAVNAHLRKLNACLVEARDAGQVQPGPLRLTMDWTVRPDGSVMAPYVRDPLELAQSALARCIARVMETQWQLARSQQILPILNYPLELRVPEPAASTVQ